MAIALAMSLPAAFLTACSNNNHDERLSAAGPEPDIDALLKVADAKAGERKFDQCAACHPISQGALDKDGPNLHGIYGRPMATNSARFAYTAALRDTGGRWDTRKLDAWIANPKAVAPGTSMQFAGISDPLDRADIIAFLQSQSGQ